MTASGRGRQRRSGRGDGNDPVDTGAGDDVIHDRLGTDRHDGGAGYDTLNLAGNSATAVSGGVTTGTEAGTARIGTQQIDSFARISLLNGTASGGGAERLVGGVGADTLSS